MFHPTIFENSRPDGIPVLEIPAPAEGAENEPRRFVPLLRTELKGEVVGPLAGLRLMQTFGYKRQQCDKVLEALYRFPLPGDAAVTSVRVRFGDVTIYTELKDRKTAEGEYKEARSQGRQAVLATRESADVFTLRIAGLKPDQETVVETFYVQLVRSEGPGWSLRIPLTTSPRYVRSDETGGRLAEGQPLALLRDPGHRFQLNLTFRDADAIKSSTHSLLVEAVPTGSRVRLSQGEVIPDRDCVLTWRPRQLEAEPALHVVLQDDPADEHVYFLALVAPPAKRDRGRRIDREVVLLVDHSGSMEGAKWKAADWAVEKFLSGLSSGDQFALGLFHTRTFWFGRALQPGSPQSVENAVHFLKRHRESGGTELGVALEQALDVPGGEDESESARHLLVITDAEVTDAGRILRLADRERSRPYRRRISVLCIDAAPNALLATELAEHGGGVARFLTSDPEEEDIATALDEVLADWSEPVLAGLRLEINRTGVQAAGRDLLEAGTPGWTAIDLGDLPAGRPVWVVGRMPRNAAGAEFRLRTGRGHEIACSRPQPARESELRTPLKALFGARRIRGLEFLIHSGCSGFEFEIQLQKLGYNADEISAPSPGAAKVYAENAREALDRALRERLTAESLDYGLACSETAFIAVRKEMGQPVEGTVLVANAFPAGWSTPHFGFHGQAVLGFTGGATLLKSRSIRQSSGGFGAMAGRLADACASYFDPSQAVADGEMADLADSLRTIDVFQGTPQFRADEAVLYDSTAQDAAAMPESATIQFVDVQFPDGGPKSGAVDAGLSLLIYVDDLAAPRAKVRVADLIRQGGRRPLNLRRAAGQTVRIVLVDPGHASSEIATKIKVMLGCV